MKHVMALVIIALLSVNLFLANIETQIWFCTSMWSPFVSSIDIARSLSLHFTCLQIPCTAVFMICRVLSHFAGYFY